ncbi:hypothetical protein HK096_006390, partial [Nowakowskiella sp. JEL0078]
RTMNFTEQLYSFNVPGKGEILDSIVTEEGNLIILSTKPFRLLFVEGNHRQAKEIEIYEFVPLQKNIPELRLSSINGKILIHNPTDHSILLLNLLENRIWSSVILDFQPLIESVMLTTLSHFGLLVFYQPTQNKIAVIDFNNNEKYTLHLIVVPILLSSVHLLHPGFWVLNSLNNINSKEQFIIHGARRIPDIFESVAVSSKNQKFLPIEYCSPFRCDVYDYPKTTRFVSIASTYGVVIGLPEMLMDGHSAEFFVWPGNRAGLKFKENLYLQKTRLLASVSIENENSLEVVLDLLLTIDRSGLARVWQTNASETTEEKNHWQKLVGNLEPTKLSIIYEKKNEAGIIVTENLTDIEGGEKGSGVGVGEGDGVESGGIGSGGSGQGAGGNGGGNAGSSEAPTDGRQSGDIADISKFSLRTSNDIPKEITDAQRELHELRMRQRLKQLEMTLRDMQTFKKYQLNIQREIRELRAILETIEAKNKERIWLKNQSFGDVDDNRLIEGVTGERLIYKRRGENDDDPTFQQKPKKLHFIFDLSASMMRFNGHDQRLDRSLEVALCM